MKQIVVVKLTQAEAAELLAVAGNGWGDGDYYGLNDKQPTRGGKKSADLFAHARYKLIQAIHRANALTDN